MVPGWRAEIPVCHPADDAVLATALGMTEANIARMEDGWLRPSTLTLERVAKARGIRLRISFERPAR